jgi:uncharacterized membrane protein YheB (UPF0754 family)
LLETLSPLWTSPETLLIPLISAFVGWFTNVLAVKMMFYPVDYVGLRPLLGWQGIIPANARRLAKTALRLVTERLLDIREIFADLDLDGFLAQHEPRIRELVRRIVTETAERHLSAMWGALAPEVKEQVVTAAEAEVNRLTREVLSDAQAHVGDLLDLERIVTSAVEDDKELMNRIFLRVGAKEFKFIERSGLYFGFLFGLVQLAVWVVYPAWWILPLFGFLVGYATNWLALRLIFEPQEPKKFAGVTFQGLFHRRQAEIAQEFSTIVSGQVMNREKLYAEFTRDSARRTMMQFVKVRADALRDKLSTQPMAQMVLRMAPVDRIEESVMAAIEEEMFRRGGFIEEFADRSEAIRETLLVRMAKMDADAFEDVLRPAFKQDEWKLILAGAALGLAAGFVQLITLFADMAI